MLFSTKVPISKSDNPIDYNSKIMFFGSCFAENMAQKFQYFKFDTIINPFGIIFNAVSIERLINRVVNKIEFTENDVFFHNDLWHCYEVHSELSNPDKIELLHNLNSILNETNNQLIKATHFVITYGTSWIYKLRKVHFDNQNIVANCHKVPQKEFSKELLSIQTIENSIKTTLKLIQKVNPNCHFIFTVSPVRHIKDGFVENTLSKSHLIAALHNYLSKNQNLQPETCNQSYFPSYEIMMDELRDYRYYATDMLHPNQTAIDYIWIQFFENNLSESVFSIMNQICDIQKALKHRAFNPNSENYKKFLDNLNQKINSLQKNNPNIKF